MPELKFFLSGIIILNLLLKIDNIMDNGLKIEYNYYVLFYLQMCLHMKVLIKKQLFKEKERLMYANGDGFVF
jgi:hypothetical protein